MGAGGGGEGWHIALVYCSRRWGGWAGVVGVLGPAESPPPPPPEPNSSARTSFQPMTRPRINPDPATPPQAKA